MQSMRWQDRRRPRGERRLRRMPLVTLAILSLLVPSCRSSTGSVSGRVGVEASLSDGTGTPTGTLSLDFASGVHVYLFGPGGVDSTVTGNPNYRFDRVRPGVSQVAVGVGGVMTDSEQVDVTPGSNTIVPQLVLRRTGDLSAWPNPFTGPMYIQFWLPATAPVRLQVVSLTGTLLRVLLDQNLVVGGHSVAWDGRDAAGQVLPAGAAYAVVLLSGPDRRAEIVVKGP